MSALRGVIAAIPTPVTSEGEPDLPRFLKLAETLLAKGCDGLNICGTTGEATSLSVAQRLGVMRAAAESLPTDRLMVGTGAAALADAIELTKAAGGLGFRAALLLPPFYFKGVSVEGLVSFFTRVLDASGIGIYLYNFPQLTGLPFKPDLVRALVKARPGRVLGMKDSSGDLAYARSIGNLGLGLDIFPSSEAVLLEARAGAFAGCISATASLSADSCAAAWTTGDADAHAHACAVRTIATAGPLIPRIKAALAAELEDSDLAHVLPPHQQLTPAESDRLVSSLADARRQYPQ